MANSERKNANNRRYRERNKERINAERRQRYAENPEYFRKISRKYHRTEKAKKHRREYREQNRDRINEQQRLYRLLHPDRVNEYRRRYYVKHAEQIKRAVTFYYMRLCFSDDPNKQAVLRRLRETKRRYYWNNHERLNRLAKERRQRFIPDHYEKPQFQIAQNQYDRAGEVIESLREILSDKQNQFVDLLIEHDFDMVAVSAELGISGADCAAIMEKLRELTARVISQNVLMGCA